ncbi:hypothetical protein [Paenibacillus sp. L3-i20]|nr:hypothetical protein [Paenibacillus sp. L3-i20]
MLNRHQVWTGLVRGKKPLHGLYPQPTALFQARIMGYFKQYDAGRVE